jgi:hypothetical protein
VEELAELELDAAETLEIAKAATRRTRSTFILTG